MGLPTGPTALFGTAAGPFSAVDRPFPDADDLLIPPDRLSLTAALAFSASDTLNLITRRMIPASHS